MDLPKRKQIRLQGFDYSQTNAYFITICTFKRAKLFGKIVGATLCGRPNSPHMLFEKRLLEIENKFPNAQIDEYIFMPDHVHFIIKIANNAGDHAGSPLPRIIDWYKTMTTNEYIKGVKSGLFLPYDKHVWQRSYYEHVIRNDLDYFEIAEYIQTNPIRWQIHNNKR